MEKDIATQKRVFGHRLKDALRRRRIWKEGGHYEWSPYPGMEEAAAFINSTDVMRAVIITDEDHALMAEIAELGGEPVDAVSIMGYAFTNELRKKIAALRIKAVKERRVPTNESHLLNPQMGDHWVTAKFGDPRNQEFIVMKVFTEDDFVVWGNFLVRDGDPDTGYLRVDRHWLAGHTHLNCGQECRLTNLDPELWALNCSPSSKDSEDYKALIEHNNHYDYSDVATIERG